MDPYTLIRGEAPLLVSLPHAGTHVPIDIAEHMTGQARHVPDTDWHVDRLYDMAAGMGATVLTATHSRYVIDLNRAPDNAPLYPGASNTELCPLTMFDFAPIYLPGQAPDQVEVAHRLDTYWRPYHDQIAAELERLRARHDRVVLWDGHTIRSEAPRFFDGRLPDFNLGTASGASAAPELADRLLAIAEQSADHGAVLNGRFKGGFITRHYGQPNAGMHAVQLELSEITYMEEDPPFRYLDDRAENVKAIITDLMKCALEWAANAN
ncbi:MAG: N-formylglutamate deformylase [Pseudomonadota bacterium]